MTSAKARPPVVVLAPDSFKGSLGAPEVCAAIATGVRRACPEAEIRSRPMADGGEGTLDVVLTAAGAHGSRHLQRVASAGGAPIDAALGILDAPEGRTALIEVAQVVGMTQPASAAVRVEDRSTSGIGQLLKQLLDAGLRRFVVGLGGSSTNEAGAGMLCALGARMLDANGAELAPTPAGLARLQRVDVSAIDRRLNGCSLTILADVDNPLCGPRGATVTFGRQKGVADAEVRPLDQVLSRFAAHAESAFGRSAATQRSAGAAGGLGFAFQLLGAQCVAGAEAVAELVKLDLALAGADWSITGEGRSDAQTLAGKAPLVAARHARKARVPVTLLSGAVDASALADLGPFFDGCFSIAAGPVSLAESIANARELLADRAEQLARFWSAARINRLSAAADRSPAARTIGGRRTRRRRA